MLTLIGISPLELIQMYASGTLLAAQSTATVKSTTREIVYDLETGTDPRTSEVYRYHNNNNSQVKVITTDHTIFSQRQHEIELQGCSVHNAHGQHLSYLPPGHDCKWCRRHCSVSDLDQSTSPIDPGNNASTASFSVPTKDSPNSLYPIGLPISMYYEESTQRLRFDTVGYFCCFGCAFAYLKMKFPRGRMITNSRMAESERLLRLMLHTVSGGSAVLKPCPDWDLLDINGGPMGERHFFAGQTTYLPMSNMLMLPAKELYTA